MNGRKNGASIPNNGRQAERMGNPSILDNEISKEMKESIRKNNITDQLAPPHDH